MIEGVVGVDRVGDEAMGRRGGASSPGVETARGLKLDLAAEADGLSDPLLSETT